MYVRCVPKTRSPTSSSPRASFSSPSVHVCSNTHNVQQQTCSVKHWYHQTPARAQEQKGKSLEESNALAELSNMPVGVLITLGFGPNKVLQLQEEIVQLNKQLARKAEEVIEVQKEVTCKAEEVIKVQKEVIRKAEEVTEVQKEVTRKAEEATIAQSRIGTLQVELMTINGAMDREKGRTDLRGVLELIEQVKIAAEKCEHVQHGSN